jgi:hypothetical protein
MHEVTDDTRPILQALALMVDQYLGPDNLDNMCISAGEKAFAVLASYGLLQSEDGRNGTWTKAANTLFGV